MAIILDEENKVVTVENQPDAPRALFKNLPEASTIEGGVGDVLINGVSIVDENGDADIPIASTTAPGAVMLGSANGTGLQIYGRILYIVRAANNDCKAGTNDVKPIVPLMQHVSAFYALAKAAGDTTQALSDNAVGNYTAEAKIAIQKMLGIYESPWEVINEGTFTNETAEEYIINTDSNSNAFELTDAIVILWVPTQENDAVIGDYGNVYFRQNNSNIRTAYLAGGSSKTIPANSAENVAIAGISQSNGLMAVEYYEWATTSTHQAAKRTLVSGADTGGTPFGIKSADIDTIRIGSFIGTMNYRLLGRRKW